MLNWAVISFNDLNLQGGHRTHIIELARSLAKFTRVTMVNPTMGFDASNEPFEFVSPTYPRIWIPGLSKSLAWLVCLWRQNRQHRFDVVYIRDSGTAKDLLICLWAKLRKIQVVVEVNGIISEERPSYRSNNTQEKWLRWWSYLSIWLGQWAQTRSYRLADKVVAVTEKLRDYLITEHQVCPTKVKVFSNGVDIQQFKLLDRDTCKGELGFDLSRQYIGFVGRFMAWQGVDDLLKGFTEVRLRYPNWRLMLIGGGPELEKWKGLVDDLNIGNHVDFVDYVPYSEIVKYLNACDILAVPKKPLRSGYSPLKVYEYLACGRPILASAVPGLTFVETESVGRVFEPDNINELSKALEELVVLSDLERKETGNRARRLAIERFSWDAIVGQIFEFVKC